MFILGRKVGETILIGDDIRITVVEKRGNRVGLAVMATRSIRVLRGELNDVTAKTKPPAEDRQILQAACSVSGL